MEILKTVEAMRAWRGRQRRPVAFVPTMGALHAGHRMLIEAAHAPLAEATPAVVVSIFVNAVQFNERSDYENYPQPLSEDLALCEAAGVAAVFTPDETALYADGYRYRVVENQYSLDLEGTYRPGHFDGVLTVVMKLINAVQPQAAYFGEKDWQQLQLVRGMAAALLMPVEIVGVPTVREADGLALSSRNRRLSAAGRALAVKFADILRNAEGSAAAEAALIALGINVEYVAEREGRRLAAVWIDGVRLIDNVALAER